MEMEGNRLTKGTICFQYKFESIASSLGQRRSTREHLKMVRPLCHRLVLPRWAELEGVDTRMLLTKDLLHSCAICYLWKGRFGTVALSLTWGLHKNPCFYSCHLTLNTQMYCHMITLAYFQVFYWSLGAEKLSLYQTPQHYPGCININITINLY